jgi:hypothetical protein
MQLQSMLHWLLSGHCSRETNCAQIEYLGAIYCSLIHQLIVVSAMHYLHD